MRFFSFGFWIIISSIILLSGIVYGIYLWNKPHRAVANEQPSFVIESSDLFNRYTTNEKLADSLYLDKVIRLKGKIKEISQTQDQNTVIVLETADEMLPISCTLDATQRKISAQYKPTQLVTLKGICTGKSLLDIVLIKCVIEN